MYFDSTLPDPPGRLACFWPAQGLVHQLQGMYIFFLGENVSV
jgi:hypothetical protein